MSTFHSENMQVFARLFLVMLLTHTLLHSNTIGGQIISGDTLEPLNRTLITVTDPTGCIVLQKMFDQRYSIELQSGNYTMRAYYYVNGVLDSYTENKFRITEDSMEFDLMLIPYELQELTPGFTPPPEPTNLTNKSNGTGVATASTPWSGLDVGIVAAIIIILLAAVLAYWVLFKPKIKFGNKETEISEKTDEKELDDDCKRVLKILKENEGRMVQKEIRNILNFSETKMSLVTTELEVSGFIRRIKKGRENVLKLVKTS